MITEHKNQKLMEDLIDLWIWKSFVIKKLRFVNSIKYFTSLQNYQNVCTPLITNHMPEICFHSMLNKQRQYI